MRSGQVQKTVRLRGGRCNPHRATQKQRGLHQSRLMRTAQCTCRGAGPSAALWQTHKPDDTPANGHLPTSEPLNVPWWSLSRYSGWLLRRRGPGCIGGLHGSLKPPEGPPDSQVYPPTFLGSAVLGSGVLSTLEKGLSITAWMARKSVPSEAKCWHRPESSTVCTFGPIQFGPAVASPFPCVWRRPRLAVAGAGIADSQQRRGNPVE